MLTHIANTLYLTILIGICVVATAAVPTYGAKHQNRERSTSNLRRRRMQVTYVELCAPTNGPNAGTYKTVEVISTNVARINWLKSRGAVEGQCRDACSSLCNHTPCFNDFVVTRMNGDGVERCVCRSKDKAKSKCAGLTNTKCGFEEKCACLDGFWGTNVTVTGCPSRGFSVRDLPYNYSDLEPYIDTWTMMLHHQRHHATQVATLNNALNGTADILKPILELQENAIAAGKTIRNNAGGHYNHAFFWTIMASPAKANKTKPSAQLQALINSSFSNTTNMIKQFNALAAPGSIFGSGWAWICVNEAGNKLLLVGTPNQDNPLMKTVVNETMFPILGLDVWEHAYYLKYQNLRPVYVQNFWNLVNWDVISAYAQYVITNKKGVSV